MISPAMAERMKMEIGSLAESTQPQAMEIRGRDPAYRPSQACLQ